MIHPFVRDKTGQRVAQSLVEFRRALDFDAGGLGKVEVIDRVLEGPGFNRPDHANSGGASAMGRGDPDKEISRTPAARGVPDWANLKDDNAEKGALAHVDKALHVRAPLEGETHHLSLDRNPRQLPAFREQRVDYLVDVFRIFGRVVGD